MVRLVYTTVLLLAGSFAVSGYAQPKWKSWKNRDGVAVSYQKAASGVVKVRAELTVKNATSKQFMALLNNTQSATQWLVGVKAVRTLASPSRYENIVYTELASPWPVADRYTLTYSCYSQPSANQYHLAIRGLDSSSHFTTATSGLVQIKTLQADWYLTDTPKGLQITHQVSADPAGNIPNWLGNKVALRNTLRSLIKLRTLLPMYSVSPTFNAATGQCDHH